MSTIKATLEAHADGTLHLPLPPELRHVRLNVTATLEPVGRETSENWPAPSPTNLKGFGCLRGKIWLASDFDEPLEDFQDYMK